MSELRLLKEDVNSAKSDIQSAMASYQTLSYEERLEKTKFIENRFSEYHQIIEEANGQLVMWDRTQANEAKTFIDSSNAEIQKMEYFFQELRKRCEQRDALFSSANKDGYNDQNMLLNKNANELNRGDQLISELSQGAATAKDTGMTIMGALNDQGRKIREIDENLTRLDTNIETGESIITEMLCRDQRRRYFLYGIIALLIIAIIVFLYFLII